MDGGGHVRRQGRLDPRASLLGHAELLAEQRLRGGGAEADEDLRLHDCQFLVEPRMAGGDLGPRGLLVDAALAAGGPLEVLHGVRDVSGRAVDAGLLERLVEHAAGRADEGLPRLVLLVAGLLADEDDPGAGRALAEDDLRPGLPEGAGAALRRRRPELIELGHVWVIPRVRSLSRGR